MNGPLIVEHRLMHAFHTDPIQIYRGSNMGVGIKKGALSIVSPYKMLLIYAVYYIGD
jgi:hypothetical protein